MRQTPTYILNFGFQSKGEHLHQCNRRILLFSHPIPPPCPSDPTSQPLSHPRSQLMIARVRSRLIKKIHRFPAQLHPLAFEPQIANPRLVLVALAPIILEKQVQRSTSVEEGALDGNLLDFVRLRELEGLRGWQVGRGAEVEVVGVEVEFAGLRSGGSGGGAEEEAVEADLGGEAGRSQCLVRGGRLFEVAHGMCMSNCSSASLFSSGSGSSLSTHVFCTILLPDLGSASFSVFIAGKSICS